MSGYDEDLSARQMKRLEKLKAVVSDIPSIAEKEDHYYLPWLRIRGFNVAKAEELIRNHFAVRSKYGLDTILTDYTPPEVLKKYFPGGFFGETRDGHPVWYDNFGNLDNQGLYHSVRDEEFLKLKCYQGEQCVQLCQQQSAKKGCHIETFTMVIDCESVSFPKHYYWPGIRMMIKIFTMFEVNYPDRVSKVFIIKAPAIFPSAYNLVKHLIDERIRKRLSVLGSDWREVLLEHISPDQLPQAYGGTRCEPDPYCTKYINPGGDVPVEYYLTNQTEANREEMERVVVTRGSSHEVHYQVETPGTVLRWEFVSVSNNIEFGWYYKSIGHSSQIVPMKRVESHIIPQTGSHTCEKSGKYILKLTNCHSWTRSKVFYSVKMLPPRPDTSPTKTTPTSPMSQYTHQDEGEMCS